MSNNIFSDVNPCSTCGTSTNNETFEVDSKRYVLCDKCEDILTYIAQREIQANKSKQREK